LKQRDWLHLSSILLIKTISGLFGHYKLPIFFLLLSFNFSVQASANQQVVILDAQPKIILGPYLSTYRDDKSSKNITEIIELYKEGEFSPNSEKVPYFGFSQSTYWAAVSFIPVQSGIYYISYEFPLIDSIDLHVQDADGITSFSSGFQKRFFNRPYKTRNYVFKLNATKDSPVTCYLRLKNDGRMEIPLYLYSEANFIRMQGLGQFMMGIFFGIMAIIFTINFLIFIFTKKKLFLLHAIFIFSFFVFITLQDGNLFYRFIPYLFSPHPGFITLTIAAALLSALIFTDHYLDFISFSKPIAVLNRTIMLCLLIFMSATFFITKSIAVQIITITTLIVLSYMIILVLIGLFRKKQSALFLATGWGVISISGIIYALKAEGLIAHSDISNYSLHIGSLFYFFIVTFGLSKTIININKEKMNAANRFTRLEKRFTSIINNSDEIVFILDSDLIIRFVNPAVKRYFLINPEEAVGKSFTNFIYTNKETVPEDEVCMIREKLAEFLVDKNPIRFQGEFVSPRTFEPKRMQIELQHIVHNGVTDILGKAVPVVEDTLLPFFEKENQTYNINNQLNTVNDIITRITRNLVKHITGREINIIRTALREIILNAIEHGNLEISYDEKTEAQNTQNYLHFLSQRNKNPLYKDRKVKISYSIDNKKAKYVITDSGKGFDYNLYLLKYKHNVNKDLYHGRGIRMTQHIFDEIIFNEAGNSVTLIKHFGNTN
jgi:PAS domain-containing protein